MKVDLQTAYFVVHTALTAFLVYSLHVKVPS